MRKQNVLSPETLKFMQKGVVLTFSRLVEKYLLELKISGLRATSIKTYQYDYKTIHDTIVQYAPETLDDVTLMTKDVGLNFIECRKQFGNKVTYINRLVKRMKLLLDYAVDENLLSVNTWEKIKRVKDNEFKTKQLPTKIEMKHLLNVARVNSKTVTMMKSYLLLNVMFVTSIRVSQALQLKFKYVDFERKTIYSPPHTNKINIPMTLVVNDQILELIKLIQNEYSFGSEYIFSTNSGEKLISRHYIDGYIKRMCAKAGMSPISAHVFRKVAITEAVKKLPIETVAKLAGHKQISTTYENYVLKNDTEAEREIQDYVKINHLLKP